MWPVAGLPFPSGRLRCAAPLHEPGEPGEQPARLRHGRGHGRSGLHAPARPGVLPVHGLAAPFPQWGRRRRLAGWCVLARSAERGSNGHGAEPGDRHLFQQLRRFVANGPHENGALIDITGWQEKLDRTEEASTTPAVHREKPVKSVKLAIHHPWKHSERFNLTTLGPSSGALSSF